MISDALLITPTTSELSFLRSLDGVGVGSGVGPDRGVGLVELWSDTDGLGIGSSTSP